MQANDKDANDACPLPFVRSEVSQETGISVIAESHGILSH
jgi:hypothetical protein